MFWIRGRALVVVAAVGAVALAATGVAYAMGALPNEVIHGCYKLTGGDLRIGANCTSKEKAIAWNLQGVQGEKGLKGDKGIQGIQGVKGDPGSNGVKGDKGDKGDPGTNGVKGDKGDKGGKGDKGDPGAKGDKGDAGAGGLTGYEVLTSTGSLDFPGVLAVNSSAGPCPAGKIVIGGGGSAAYDDGSSPPPVLASSYPEDNGWSVEFVSAGGSAFAKKINFTAYAVCATGTA